MGDMRAWKYRLYPSKSQKGQLNYYLYNCKNLWNSLLEYTKNYYEETKKFPNRKQLYLLTKETKVFSQVAQNVADRLVKSLKGMLAKKKLGKKAGFPRFKSIERMKSFAYPQFGFRLIGKKLELSNIGSINIKKHRELKGQIKTLTIKKSASGKWFVVFTTEFVATKTENKGPKVGIDLGIENFAYMSDSKVIENPRHLKQAELQLQKKQRQLSRKKKGSKNREKVKLKVAVVYERLANRRRDFLHKTSRFLVNKYSLLALENLNIVGLAKGFLAKEVHDCSWAEFLSMLHYKAEEAGCEVILVDPANTTSECSNCGYVQKKSLAERWHGCSCGASMPRDLNAAINILNRSRNASSLPAKANRATLGIRGSNACGEETPASYKYNWQVSSRNQEAHGLVVSNSHIAKETEIWSLKMRSKR